MASVTDPERAPGRSAPSPVCDPALSVVVASFRTRALLDACLASLLPQCAARGAELVVARPMDEVEMEALRGAYPAVRFVRCPPAADIPRLRSAGMAVASGELVALTEDHCVAAPGWLGRLADVPGDVIGGAMANARTRSAIDWGAYFSEYGFFASSGEAGGVPLLTGANVAYRRTVVEEVVRWSGEGEWENVIHARLHGAGRRLAFVPDATIAQNQSYSLRAFCRDRYQHGRDYARRRLALDTGTDRWVRVGTTALLPLVLTGRVARSVRSNDRGAFLRALPATFAFLSAWALGETVGYLLGPVRRESDDD